MKIDLFEVGAFGIMATICLAMSVLIYTGKAPPMWMAFPIPPLMATVIVGLWLDR